MKGYSKPLKRLSILSLAACLAGAPPALADQVDLANGDRVTGTVLGLDQEGLAIDSEYMGTVTVEWDAVERLEAEGPLYVVVSEEESSGARVAGPMVVEGNRVDLVPAIVERSQITAIRSQSRQDAFLAGQEAEPAPPPAVRWSARADGGLSATSGNADTRSVNLAFRGARTTDRDRTSFYLTSLFASNSTTDVTLTTANAVRGGGRYEIDVSEHIFTFGFSDLEFDRFQDLDLRLVLGAGAGVNILETPRTALQVFGGGSSNQEFFDSGESRKTGESVLGEEWTYRINDTTSLTERLAVYPNLTNRGQYRINFDTSAETALNGWLSWQITLTNRYQTNPRPGKQKNDLLFTTGIRVTFGQGNVGSVGPGNINFR